MKNGPEEFLRDTVCFSSFFGKSCFLELIHPKQCLDAGLCGGRFSCFHHTILHMWRLFGVTWCRVAVKEGCEMGKTGGRVWQARERDTHTGCN